MLRRHLTAKFAWNPFIATVVASRLVGIAAGLALVRVAARLDTADFNTWAFASSALAVVSMADIGICAASVTDLAPALANWKGALHPGVNELRADLRRVLLYTAPVLSATVLLAAHFILGGQTIDHAARLAPMLFLAFCSVGLGWAPRVLMSGQRKAQYEAVNLAGGAATIIFSVALLALPAVGIAAIAILAIQPLTMGIIARMLVGESNSRPRTRSDKQRIRGRLKHGSRFVAMTAIGLLSFQFDIPILLLVQQTGAVSEYLLLSKLGGVAPLFVGSLVLPLWASVAAARAQNDSNSIVRLLKRYTALALAINITWGVIAIAVSERASEVLGLKNVSFSMYSKVALILWLVANALTAPLAMVANGLALYREQVKLGVVSSLLNVGLSYLLARHIGAAGPLLASAAIQLLLVVPFVGHAVRHRLTEEIDGFLCDSAHS